MGDKQSAGTIVWTDLTVDDAEGVRDFYREVVGSKSVATKHGGFRRLQHDGPGTTGKRHAGGRRLPCPGGERDPPAQWLVNVQVEDVEASAQKARDLGGSVVDGPRGMGSLRFCVIRDPAGAVLALVGPR
jgi:hypothetical protein